MTGGGSSIPEVQRLLATLAGSKVDGNIAEIGSAFGEGALAIASALSPGATFVTVEPDPVRYARAREVLAQTRAAVLNARWQDVLPERAPFDLIFFDGGASDEIVAEVDTVIELLSPGGILIKDDLTPGHTVESDPLRAALLQDTRLEGVAILAVPDMAVIIATRRA